MEWLNIILGALVAIFAGLNVFQLFSFRAYKKKYQMEAEKDVAEASESKQSALERRLASLEKLYTEQGKLVDELREEILRMSKEKFTNELRMTQLESENSAMRERVDGLEKELQAYKTITGK